MEFIQIFYIVNLSIALFGTVYLSYLMIKDSGNFGFIKNKGKLISVWIILVLLAINSGIGLVVTG